MGRVRLRTRVAAACVLAASLAPTQASAEPRRFALSAMHFNVQYVAGGLAGFYGDADPALEQTAEQVEDAIIVESFEPVLDIFLAHPAWGANVEMQGYMLDVIAERHPPVLEKLRALSVTGQIEVMSFHYSDQLFMAYPRQDWERSADLTRATFDKHGVPLSPSVFCQEGQAGAGMAEAMAERGYETLIFPKNLFSYQHGGAEPAPLYRLGSVQMVTSQGLSFDDGKDGVDTTWWFVDDGELLVTGDNNPYFPEVFKVTQEHLSEVVASLQSLEDAGYSITTVAKYLAAIGGDVTPVEPPPLLDGTWQPSSTDGIRRWLGGFGLWWRDERDNDVRTLGAVAHRELLAAETAAAAAGIVASEEIAAGFRLLALAQVTDATGINPFRGEVEYGIAHATEAMRIARGVIGRAKEALGHESIRIDTQTGEVASDAAGPDEGAAMAPPLALEVTSGDRPHEVTFRRLSEGHTVVTIHFGVGDERLLSVTFPGTMTDILYTPGLTSEPVRVPRGAFVFDHYQLALSDGLIGLSEGRSVIKDQATVHVAAEVSPSSGDVRFGDDTAPAGETITWVFHLVDGSDAEAAAVARGLNVLPRLWR